MLDIWPRTNRDSLADSRRDDFPNEPTDAILRFGVCHVGLSKDESQTPLWKAPGFADLTSLRQGYGGPPKLREGGRSAATSVIWPPVSSEARSRVRQSPRG